MRFTWVVLILLQYQLSVPDTHQGLILSLLISCWNIEESRHYLNQWSPDSLTDIYGTRGICVLIVGNDPSSCWPYLWCLINLIRSKKTSGTSILKSPNYINDITIQQNPKAIMYTKSWLELIFNMNIAVLKWGQIVMLETCDAWCS